MSSIKKVLCVKAKNEGLKLFTTGVVYDVVSGSETDEDVLWVCDDLGRKTFIILCSPCIHGEWQPLEEYICINATLIPAVKFGCILFGYEANGLLKLPIGNLVLASWRKYFKKLSEMPQKAKSYQRHEVRHVIYDTKDNKIVNDAMGECYITLAEAQELCDEMNAPKVMKTKYTKEIEYFGMKVFVPDDAKWLSTTMYGTVFAHCSKTAPSESVCFHAGSDDHVVMGGIDLNGIDWKDTLVEIK